MCYIMISKHLNGVNKVVEQEIREILESKSSVNSDGFFIKNAGGEIRTLEKEKVKEQIGKARLDNFMAHFRLASAGVVSEENVHGWTIDDWMFMHNGSCSTYINDWNQKTVQKDADSLLLFQDITLLLADINPKKDRQVAEAIKTAINSVNFFGRAVLYNKRTDRLYVFGDFYVYNFSDSHLILSSQSLFLAKGAEKEVKGFKLKQNQTTTLAEGTIDGIGVISNFSKPGFRYQWLSILKEPYVAPATEYHPLGHARSITPYNEGYQELFDSLGQCVDSDGNPFYHDDDNWSGYERLGGVVQRNLQRKSRELVTNKKENKDGITIEVTQKTPEIMAMKENIDKAQAEIDDLDLDLKDAPLANVYIPEDEEEAEILRLNEQYGFVGWNHFGDRMYRDEVGIHDEEGNCCNSNTCRDVTDLSGITMTKPIDLATRIRVSR